MNSGGVLRDLCVLDFGRYISAPYCGMLLADMGARGSGSSAPAARKTEPLACARQTAKIWCIRLARNKEAITLDFRNIAGRALLEDLMRHCDVLLHNFSPGCARGFRTDLWADSRDEAGRDLHRHLRLWSQRGPQSGRGGFDPIIQARLAAAALVLLPARCPLRSGVPWVDYSTGLSAAFGTMALRHRDQSGEGQQVDCALLQTAVSFTAPMIAEALVTGRERPRLGNRAPYVGPSDLYACRDGYVYAAVITEQCGERCSI